MHRHFPIIRRTRLAPISAKKLAELRDHKEPRDDFRLAFNFCMLCRKPLSFGQRVVHEMTPGYANRPKAVGRRDRIVIGGRLVAGCRKRTGTRAVFTFRPVGLTGFNPWGSHCVLENRNWRVYGDGNSIWRGAERRGDSSGG